MTDIGDVIERAQQAARDLAIQRTLDYAATLPPPERDFVVELVNRFDAVLVEHDLTPALEDGT